jgi:hypothetical protein
MSTALRDTSVSLQTLITTTLSADPEVQALLPPGGSLNVSLNTPEEMGQAAEQGLSLWLYRVVRDENLLNVPPRRIASDRLRPAPLPMRLHYLLTPVFDRMQGVSAPEFEQIVLGKVLQLFHEQPQLRGSRLVGALTDRDLEISVRLETLTLDELSRVWDALERSYQLSLAYEVTVIPIDSRRDITTGPPVNVFAPELGVASLVAR